VKKKSVGREPSFREDMGTEAEESPLLEVVSRERLVKMQAGNDVMCSVVISKVWK
jgi:hypothetical protein